YSITYVCYTIQLLENTLPKSRIGASGNASNFDKVRVAFCRFRCIFRPQSVDLTRSRGTFKPRNYFKVSVFGGVGLHDQRMGKSALCNFGTGSLDPDQAALDLCVPTPPGTRGGRSTPERSARLVLSADAQFLRRA